MELEESSSTTHGLMSQQLESGQFWLLPHRVFELVIELFLFLFLFLFFKAFIKRIFFCDVDHF